MTYFQKTRQWDWGSSSRGHLQHLRQLVPLVSTNKTWFNVYFCKNITLKRKIQFFYQRSQLEWLMTTSLRRMSISMSTSVTPEWLVILRSAPPHWMQVPPPKPCWATTTQPQWPSTMTTTQVRQSNVTGIVYLNETKLKFKFSSLLVYRKYKL